MRRNHSERVHGAVERLRPVRPSSESGSTATGRARSSGDAFVTPTGARVGCSVGVADGIAVATVPPGAAVAAEVADG
jgi:hypothetical protein